MVDNSNVLIAVYDRNMQIKSRTGYTVNKAIRMEHNILFVDLKTQAV